MHCRGDTNKEQLSEPHQAVRSIAVVYPLYYTQAIDRGDFAENNE